MNDMNQIILVGNVGKVETRAAGNQGQFVCNFAVATKHSWKDKATDKWKDETTWHNCVKWLKHETDAPNKGDRVFVEGKLATRSYEKDGQTRYVTEVKVNNFFNAPRDSFAGPMPVAKTFTDQGAFDDSNIPF